MVMVHEVICISSCSSIQPSYEMAAVDSSVIEPERFNPLANNKFLSRDDVVGACKSLFEPLVPYFSLGRARVQIDPTTSTWDRAACDLEGWARPLFGIAPMVYGGADFAHFNFYREGLRNGTNPAHREYWGDVKSMDQRHVEAAAIGYALMLVPEHIWVPLDKETKDRAAKWLLESSQGEHAPNNHMFFRVCKYAVSLIAKRWYMVHSHELRAMLVLRQENKDMLKD